MFLSKIFYLLATLRTYWEGRQFTPILNKDTNTSECFQTEHKRDKSFPLESLMYGREIGCGCLPGALQGPSQAPSHLHSHQLQSVSDGQECPRISFLGYLTGYTAGVCSLPSADHLPLPPQPLSQAFLLSPFSIKAPPLPAFPQPMTFSQILFLSTFLIRYSYSSLYYPLHLA